MAAFLPPDLRASLLQSLRLVTLTDRTLTDRSRVKRDWEQARKRGFAIDDEETIVGAAFLAAPLFDSEERVCGSISVGVLKARCSAQIAERIARHVKEACHNLSQELKAARYVHASGGWALDYHEKTSSIQGKASYV